MIKLDNGTGTGSKIAANGLKNSENSPRVSAASPSVSILLIIAKSSISGAKCPYSLKNAPRFTVVINPLLYLSTDLKDEIEL